MSTNENEKKKEFTIYVNGEQKVVTSKHITYSEIVALAFTNPPSGGNILFTVTYEDGPPPNPQGSILEGEDVKIDDGMIFNVTATDKS